MTQSENQDERHYLEGLRPEDREETRFPGFNVYVDESLPPDAMKFIHPDGREDVFIGPDKNKVIEDEPY